jgi:LysR family transcriptional regulator, low CO2-responsive transcriptional regulator
MSISQRVTLRQLRIFEAAARHLHFGRAAAEVHVTQPAVSIQLKQLEAEVGLPLFEQLGRRIHLTRAGGELAAQARTVLAAMRETDQAMQALQHKGGELHVAATTTAEYFAPHLLAAFRRNRPGLKVRLMINNRDAVVRELTDNTVDLAVMGRAPRGLKTIATAFARHPLAFVAPAGHRLTGQRRLRLAQLADETFLIREHGSGTRNAMEAAFATLRFRPAETLEIGPNEAIKQAVLAGMGVGFISLHTIGLELATKRLVALPVAGTPIMRDWYVVHRRQKRLPPAAVDFKELLITEGARLIRQALA